MWTEHRNPEGRTYWFNTGTRESVWEKPDDLKTPFERALGQTKWKEYFSGGRKYYYNTDNKESKWDMPDELLLLLEKVEKDSAANQPAPSAIAPAQITSSNQGAMVPAGSSASPIVANPQATQLNGTDGALSLHTGALPLTPASALPVRPNLPDDPVIPHNGFLTVEEGEKAFMHLLRKAGVDADWTWDQTMRTIITDPLYKALNTLAEKKAAWQKFTDALKAKDREERETRLSKLRPAIRNMLRGNPNVFHYTTFATADKIFSQHPIWQQAKVEAERKLIFEEYVSELKQREVQETRAARARSVSKVVSIFKELDVDVLTRWRKAHELVLESAEWKEDSELRKLPTLDILLAFEDYSRVKEREFEEQMRRSQVEKIRKERKAREGFKNLLAELVDQGKIKARTKWKQVYPSFAKDERYLNILGNPGSNPLELFWDLVDGLDQKLDAKIVIIEEVMRKYNSDMTPRTEADTEPKTLDTSTKVFTVGPDTTYKDFKTVASLESDVLQKLTEADFQEVYDNLHQSALRKHADEKRRMERKQRHLQDDLRYALKKLPEPLDITLAYEAAVPLIEHLPEYKAISEEEGRRAAFAKFVKRQKERLREAASEDGASTTSRKRKDPPRSGKDDRDRDRGRDHDKEARVKHHHRSTEDDSYGHPRDHARERDRDHSSHYDKDKEREHRSKHYRDDRDGRDERSRDKRSSRSDHAYASRDEVPAETIEVVRDQRDRSASAYKDDLHEKRDSGTLYDDKTHAGRAEKRAKYHHEDDREAKSSRPEKSIREETPEEGEI
ncbi:hypothetical protein SERLA73DRAFT_164152 [Serpula lacrymans var. lacrymans S7.3]|uniref:Formin binding protein n=2 Tax=Serpula lacrymans var. lacrymans TaxID=341189 RepID=F8QHF8_SERL3|nr:uncharacterized protein SERLADRAFT_440268 [Serpula lacrymans var. lacrymans S7.9]EGN92268.1 hypothetical protein SERLA73DRAFT_164152 [Serpula lacrymans var. lacrymans S7.3]EGO22244.1 hypothetical protein SERLADRAFT_440268 [Serpula lacrymans var. lacrymans S7.9]